MERGDCICRRTRYVLPAAALFLAALGGYLFLASRYATNRKVPQAQHASTGERRERLMVGSVISRLQGRTIAGQSVTFDLSRQPRKTLLLILSPTCSFCKVNFHNWRAILELVCAERVIYVDVADMADDRYLREYGIPLTAKVIRLSAEDTVAAGFGGTPTTVVLGPRGVVMAAYSGVLEDAQMKELRGLLTRPDLDQKGPAL